MRPALWPPRWQARPSLGQDPGQGRFSRRQGLVGQARVRGRDGREMPLPSWEAAQSGDFLGRWATNLMLINVSTRRFTRAVRLPEGDIPSANGDSLSKSAVSRRFVALSAAQLQSWIKAELSKLDLLVIKIDAIHIEPDLVLLAAVGIDAECNKHPLGVMEEATENAAVVQALLDNLIDRGLDPKVCRLFIVDGAKALRKAIRRSFAKHTPIQRCRIHKGRNIMERLPKHLHASVRGVLRQAGELDDVVKAEQLIRNLARRLEPEAPGVSETILEGIDEVLTVVRLKLPMQLHRSLACTNIIENMMGTIRRVCRNVKHSRTAAMALRWAGAAMQEAAKGFRRLKPHKQLPVLRAALFALQTPNDADRSIVAETVAAEGLVGR